MFEKIKHFFSKLFNKQKLLEEKQNEEKIETELNQIKKNDFRNEININTKIMDLQKMYERGIITEDDLTISQIKQLIKLYREQLNIQNI